MKTNIITRTVSP